MAKTRRVLDAFANRIGDNTWQTVMTQDGLLACKSLLNKTASKSTALSCHWARSRSELLWMVGSRNKFNQSGIVPVNKSELNIKEFQDSHEWKTLPLIKYAAAIAGLFHDFGKANKLFQDKLNPDKKLEKFEPYRHEWISVRLFQAFVGQKTDVEWLDALANGEFPTIECITDGYNDYAFNRDNHPLTSLPPFAQLVAWLVLTHHHLPRYPSWKHSSQPSFSNIEKWLENEFTPLWNSPNCQDADQQQRLQDNWTFLPLPYLSMQWRSYACQIASKARHQVMPLLVGRSDMVHEELFNSHIGRLALMMADHYISSLSKGDTEPEWANRNYHVYANTEWLDDEKTKKGYKQQLDEHLVGVAIHAGKIVNQLPKFKSSLPSLGKNEFLTSRANRVQKFEWQNTAQDCAASIGENTRQQGFFGINMASTGCGKTLANAKIMHAIGQLTGGVRFNVALGLRTLTLQTGREFQNVLKLNDEDLAIAVGGIAVKTLFEMQQQSQQDQLQTDLGSESVDDFLNPDLSIHYSGKSDQSHALYSWLKDKPKVNTLIEPSVLVCTIDHLIPATEGVKGGQQIGPMLRLLSSDLILDEPDDFGLDDLPALCRLVHWTGMLGSRLLLSTATMPPSLVYACFEAYQAGWAHYAKANLSNWDGSIQCAWFDEQVKPISKHITDLSVFKPEHQRFVQKRVESLRLLPAQRLGQIVSVQEVAPNEFIKNTASAIHTSITELHRNHHSNNGIRQEKSISFGLVRMANIDPLVAVAKALLTIEAPENTCMHYCVYHSRFPLVIRSFIEQQLDTVLNRKDPDAIWQHPYVQNKLQAHPAQHHIFVVLASPVAEVGRDHDYDWAVVEPSSLRSIVQLAGRVLRHRAIVPTQPNIYLLNKNIKAQKGKRPYFTKPGFETHADCGHIFDPNLLNCLEPSDYLNINSIPNVTMPNINPNVDLKDRKWVSMKHLEHVAQQTKLISSKNPDAAMRWWQTSPHWCGEVQNQQRFRDSKKDISIRLFVKDGSADLIFRELNESKKPAQLGVLTSVSIIIEQYHIEQHNVGFWFDLQPKAIYQNLAEHLDQDLEQIGQNFGELRVISYGEDQMKFFYESHFGIYQQ